MGEVDDKVIARKFLESVEAQEIVINEILYRATKTPSEMFICKLSEAEKHLGFAQALFYLAKKDLHNAIEICDAIECKCTQIPAI